MRRRRGDWGELCIGQSEGSDIRCENLGPTTVPFSLPGIVIKATVGRHVTLAAWDRIKVVLGIPVTMPLACHAPGYVIRSGEAIGWQVLGNRFILGQIYSKMKPKLVVGVY